MNYWNWAYDKIAIYNTKHTKTQTYLFKKESETEKHIIYQTSIIHILYILYILYILCFWRLPAITFIADYKRRAAIYQIIVYIVCWSLYTAGSKNAKRVSSSAGPKAQAPSTCWLLRHLLTWRCCCCCSCAGASAPPRRSPGAQPVRSFKASCPAQI